MDRVTAYAGALIAETDPLKAQQNAMIALGWAAQSTLGTASAVDGFALTPTTPASLVANLAPGAIYQVGATEATVWSSLPANSASLVKQGLMTAVDPITFTPPSANGYSQAFLVEVQYADLDTNPVLLPYYNAANPSQPYSGPGGNGQSQNTARLGIVAVQVKAGAAVSGTPATPTPDAGWVGLYVVTLSVGQTTITSGNIAVYSGAPFIPVKLPQVPAGVQAGQWVYGPDSGTAGALAVALSPVPASQPDGMEIRVKALNAAAGADVINVAGVGALPIKRRGGLTPIANDWAAGDILSLCRSGSTWQVTGLLPSDTLQVIQTQFLITSPITKTIALTGSPDFASPAAAINWLGKYLITSTGSVTFQMAAGQYVSAAALRWDHPNISRVVLKGTRTANAPTTLAVTGSSASARLSDANTNLTALRNVFQTELQFTGGRGITSLSPGPTFQDLLITGDNTGSEAAGAIGLDLAGGGILSNVAMAQHAGPGVRTRQGVLSVPSTTSLLVSACGSATASGAFVADSGGQVLVSGTAVVAGGGSHGVSCIGGSVRRNGGTLVSQGNALSGMNLQSSTYIGGSGTFSSNGANGVSAYLSQVDLTSAALGGNGGYGLSADNSPAVARNVTFPGGNTSGTIYAVGPSAQVDALSANVTGAESPQVNTVGNRGASIRNS